MSDKIPWCVAPDYYLTSSESKYLTGQMIILILVYGSTLFFAIHNTYNYLILQGRWRITLMLAFYGCVYCILVFRIVSLIYYMLYF